MICLAAIKPLLIKHCSFQSDLCFLWTSILSSGPEMNQSELLQSLVDLAFALQYQLCFVRARDVVKLLAAAIAARAWNPIQVRMIFITLPSQPCAQVADKVAL